MSTKCEHDYGAYSTEDGYCESISKEEHDNDPEGEEYVDGENAMWFSYRPKCGEEL